MLNLENITCMHGMEIIDVDSLQPPPKPVIDTPGYKKYKYRGFLLTIGGYAGKYGISRHSIRSRVEKGIRFTSIMDNLINKKNKLRSK